LGFIKDRGMRFGAEWDMVKKIAFVSLVFVALSVCLSVGAPEPAVVQGPGQWTIDVVFEHPREIMLLLASDKEPRRQGSHQFLESLDQTSSKILQGADNTKDVVVVWPDFAPKAKNIRLYVAGLSNETVVIDHPVAKDEGGEPVKIYLRKTLELSYGVSGDPALRSEADLSYSGKRWVMR